MVNRRLGPTHNCAWCGRPAEPVTGLLAQAYPGRTVCSGCSRLQLHCSCPDAVGMKAVEKAA